MKRLLLLFVLGVFFFIKQTKYYKADMVNLNGYWEIEKSSAT